MKMLDIGGPVQTGSAIGTRFVKESEMTKAQSDGTYTLNGVPHKVFKGDVVPDGAEYTAKQAEPVAEVADEPQAKAKDKPQNKAATFPTESK